MVERRLDRMTRLCWLGAMTAAACASACTGTTGTINLQLTTAPGSTVLDPVTRLRVRLTDPPSDEEVTRSADGGFDLSLSLPAGGEVGVLIVEGYDQAGTLVATGESPPFSVSPTNARIVIYIAAPLSIAAAPVPLGPVRSGVAGVTLPYGVLFAGGRDALGAPSDAIAIYNAYDHSLSGGLPMPVKRAEFAMGGNSGGVYMIGGVGTDGAPVATVLRFDTTAQPSGAYISYGEQPAFARSGELAIPIGTERYLLTGTPPGELVGGELAARTEIATLPPVGAVGTGGDGILTAVFVGEAGLVRFRTDRFDMLAGVGRVRAAVTELPTSGRFVVAGGGTPTVPVRDVLVIDPATGIVETRTDLLGTARFSPSIAATDRYLVIAGGTDAADLPVPTAEVFDAGSLVKLAELPIAARAGAHAFTLPNGQILIAGGAPATDLIELFTPPPPE